MCAALSRCTARDRGRRHAHEDAADARRGDEEEVALGLDVPRDNRERLRTLSAWARWATQGRRVHAMSGTGVGVDT
jgi:hypothetical protein